MPEFFIDPASSGVPFPHYWEMCVGSCHAVMALRSDWRPQLEKCHRELGFQYVRFHGLLDDAMSVCVRENASAETKGRLRYSFFNIDSIFDFLLSIGMKPFIELGFMPSALASGTATCFHYKANVTPPNDYDEWEELIQTLVHHLVERYGLAEVRSWFFEVWNEPNLSFFWAGSKADYFKLYRHSVDVIKSVDAQLRVGGPATSVNAWIPDMLDFCNRTSVPIDFVSTHHYPTDDPLWKHGGLTMEEIADQFPAEVGRYERGILTNMAKKARAQAGDLPLFYTEWNTSAVLPDGIHDEPYSAAMVVKTIADNTGLVDCYSFWTFSDLFEEAGQLAAPFHGGYGLQTIHGIPKPTYQAFGMLHHLGNTRVSVEGYGASTVDVLATLDGAKLLLLACNHNVPGAPIDLENVSVVLRGISPNTAVMIARIDETHANPKKKWVELGCPEYPSDQELQEIEKASRVIPETFTFEVVKEGTLLNFPLPPHGVALITVDLTG